MGYVIDGGVFMSDDLKIVGINNLLLWAIEVSAKNNSPSCFEEVLKDVIIMSLSENSNVLTYKKEINGEVYTYNFTVEKEIDKRSNDRSRIIHL